MSHRNPQTEIEPIDEESEGMMEIDPFAMVAGALQTEEGETLVDILKSIATQLETHNKLMVKLVALATKFANTPAA